MSDTVVPRAGLSQRLTLVLQLDRFRQYDTKELGIIESELNDKYSEPEDGRSLVFDTNIPDQGFQTDTLEIKTTASELDNSIIDDIISIVEFKIGDIVDGWSIRSTVGRQSMAPDFL